jgi:AGZA family xanthine/uracil permease-like MFS transporter
MGENAFIAFSLATWQQVPVTVEQRLGAVFVGGAALAVLTLVGLRSWLANSISPSMKHSFAVGIGLFLLLIGMYETGIIQSFVTGMPAAALLEPGSQLLRAPDVPLKIGNLTDVRVLLAVGGFVLMSVLLYWRVPGALLLGIVGTAGIGFLLGQGEPPTAAVAIPFQEPYSLAPIALKLDIPGVLRLTFLPILLTLFLMSFLDTLGSLVGVGSAGQMLDKEGNFPEIEKPMMVDALACMFSALVGTSTSGAYIESAAGIREGARTGLAAVVTALLFGLALCFLPLFQPLQHLRYAYGPALMAVAVLMLGSATKINFDDLTEAVPALATIAMMVFTYNIANGLTAGLVLYPVFKVATGRWRDLKVGALLLGALCLVYYVFGIPH